MTKTKTKISKQLKLKGNSELVKTINLAKNLVSWKRVADILSYPRRKKIQVNLDEISEKTNGEIVLIPGKILSRGELNDKKKIIAFSISNAAREKLALAKVDYSTIIEEIKKNPDARGIEILE